jgi:Rieske Fe-S protein
MPGPRAVPRRSVLAGGLAASTAAAVAACSGGAAGTPPAKQPAGKRIAALDAVPVGGSKSVSLPDGSPAVLTRLATDTVVCLSAVCTHQGCTVQPTGSVLDCPCHGSRFNARTGAVLQGPAVTPLPKVAVRVSGSDVVTG